MGQSTFIQQYRLLLWKNWILKLRQPFSTVLEILIPLGVILILILVRTINSQFRVDQCYLKEKQMNSLGPLPFIRDFLCTFNSTCYTNDQINWNTSAQNDFQIFLSNFSTVYSTFPKVPLTMNIILQWMSANPSGVQTFISSYTYIVTVLTPFLQVVQLTSASNSTMSLPALSVLSSFVCGSSTNDMLPFIAGIFNSAKNSSSLPSNDCSAKLLNTLGNTTLGKTLYNLIAPLYLGKIYYWPVSSFTQELIKRANSSFVIIDMLRLASIEWRLHFQGWVNNQLFNNSIADGIRISSKACMTNAEMAKSCDLVNNLLNQTGLQTLISQVTTVFSFFENILGCMTLNKFVPLQSPLDLDNFPSSELINVFAGIVFDSSLQYMTKSNATFLNYTIRMPTSRIDSTTNFKVLDRYWTPAPRRNTLSNMKYYTSGFLVLQEEIDRAFIDMVTNTNQPTNIGSTIEIMPTPCYVNDQFITFASSLMPFFMVIAWLPTYAVLVKTIVQEKEKRLKEFMLIMGLSHFVHWLAWLTIAILITIIPTIIGAFILHYRKVLQFSSVGVLLLLLFSYTVSFICQAFMLSTFFNKANVASVVSGLLYFLLYVPFLILINVQDQLTDSIYFVTSLLCQVSYCNAWNIVANWEQATIGAQFSNMMQNTALNINFGVGHCIIMLWVDAVIYLLITWYVEAVFPGEFGIPKPFYFFATARYWNPKKGCCKSSDVTPYEMNLPSNRVNQLAKPDGFEEVSDNLKVAISIQDLTKQFPSMSVPSVNMLNLDFYKSQITAFLGHNGAGKTTTISMLTGIYPPTSGTAYILNQDIRVDIDDIRQILGLCPQHNILFDILTVEDHIYFYGRLKGMSNDDIKGSLPSIVSDVGLTKKLKTQSKQLSGGMKRKLSVAMAFIGDSKAIFLDEPTAGVDPFARRGIWDLLIKYRSPEKTIVLTTHHMDEADYLSDRIAIISQGQLKCCGSSVFLKRKFGEGYYLILVKNSMALLEEFNEKEFSPSAQKIFQFVKKHVSNAKLVEETRTQWTVVLPLSGLANNGFTNLFIGLDKSLEVLNIASYGLSDTSLEEVFLKLANDPSHNEGMNENTKLSAEILDGLTDDGDLPRPRSRLSLADRSDYCVPDKNEYEVVEENIEFTLLTGSSLLRQQMIGLQIKRFHYTKRNMKGLVAELILPVLMVILIVGVLNNINPLTNQPSMTVYPWLMMPKARMTNLNTFYRQEDTNNVQMNTLTNTYQSDVGESGVRCMNKSLYSLPALPCYSTVSSSWSNAPSTPIPMQSAECDCTSAGFQQCSDSSSGGPLPSSRTMASSDFLNNLSGYNLSDHLMKKFKLYAQKQYGGFQYLLPSYYGQSCQTMGNLTFWSDLRGSINTTVFNATNFVNYFQQFLVLSGVRTYYVRLWINNKGYISMPAYSNILSNVLLRSQLNSSVDPQNYGILLNTYPFKYTEADLQSQATSQMFLQVSLVNFVILAIALISASFVIFLIEERVSGSKRQQFVSGINPYVYWVSNFTWDIIKYLISALLIVLVFVCFNYQSYIGSKNVGCFISLLCLYGFAIIPHMYPFSFVISTPSTAFVVLSAYNMFVGSLTTITTYFLDQLQTTQTTLTPINDALKLLFLIFPQYGLGRGMMDIATKYLTYNITNGQSDYDPFSWDIAGKNLASFGILFVFWVCVMILIESGIISRTICGKIKNFNLKKKEISNDEDINVALERERVSNNSDNNDVLRVIDLTKIYNAKFNCKSGCGKDRLTNENGEEKRKLAVNNICFGVKSGECFGLLGVNGAGKTTTFKMLTGEELVTKGEATINGSSIINEMVEAHKNMGFCPQFDALHALLTCEEELYFYCRIRGIDPLLIKQTVEKIFQKLSISPHATKTTQSLSGGNKRKLSTAISLVGSPKVIFMDEPTSGMDAGARRFLWNVIQKLTNQQRAVVLTSHNMEECEVLCHRLAIMVDGQFQCLGSVQQLKSEFGDDYYVTLRMNANCDQNGDRINIKNLMEQKFKAGVSVKDENFVSLQYRLDPGIYKLHVIFDFFESLKDTGMVLDYSVCQTTLDEIFINFAKKQDKSRSLSAANLKAIADLEETNHTNPGYDDSDNEDTPA